MTPDELATARGHQLGKVDDVADGKYQVRACRRCGARLVTSVDPVNAFGYALEADCARNESDDAA